MAGQKSYYAFYETPETIREHFLEKRREVAISEIQNGLH
jgi:hypothetical protein